MPYRNSPEIILLLSTLLFGIIKSLRLKRFWAKAILFLMALFFLSTGLYIYIIKTHVAVATCYWVGDTNPAVWNDAAHWLSSSGGAGSTCDSGVVPGSDDTVIFDGLGTNSVTIDAAVNVVSKFGIS